MLKLTDSQKRTLRSIARESLGMKSNAPLKKIMDELGIASETSFYKQMSGFVDQALDASDPVISTIVQKEEAKILAVKEKRRAAYRKKADKSKSEKKAQPKPRQTYGQYPVGPGTGFEDMRQILGNHMGRKVLVQYVMNGLVIEQHVYDLSADLVTFKKQIRDLWYNRFNFRPNSDDVVFEDGVLNVVEAFQSDVDISREHVKTSQQFREGETNCLLTPIYNWAQTKYLEAKSKNTKSRYGIIKNKVAWWIGECVSGVSHEQIKAISNDLTIRITVELPFQSVPYISESPNNKILSTFRYMNSKINHVDRIVDLNDITVCTRTELLDLVNQCNKDDLDYYYTTDQTTITKVYTGGRVYSVSSAYHDFISAYEKEMKVDTWKIDALKYPELTKFLDDSCHYNCCMDLRDAGRDNVDHIDQVSCYRNYAQCSYFEGFLTRVTDFRLTSKIQGLGIYLITNIVITDPKFKRLNDTMKIYVDGNCYASPALKFLSSVGKYTVVGGCWGMTVENIGLDTFSNVDGTFMLKDNGVPYYSKYVGACNSIKYDRSYYIKGDSDMAKVIQENTDSDVWRYSMLGLGEGKSTIQVTTKKNSVRHLSHVTSFVLEYARLNIIEQLMSMKYESIVRVNSDGIYFTGDVPQLKNNYRVKESACFRDGKFTTYNGSDGFVSNIWLGRRYAFGQRREYYRTELAIGGGGSGKTHFNLTDTGAVSIVYVAPMWKLARSKAEEYGCMVSTHAALLMCDPTNYAYKTSTTILVDEVSMMTNQEKEIILGFYTNHKIIFAGDIDYQIPFVSAFKKDGSVFTSSGIDNVMAFNTDHRAKCCKLKNLKTEIRRGIDRGMTRVPESLISKFISVSESELRARYDIEDMILCNSNDKKNSYKDLIQGSRNKYYVTKTSGNRSCGDIVILDAVEPDMEIRHAYTVHSIQGETCRSNLYIRADGMDMRMFYTAVSRAQYLDKIFIVRV